VGPRRGHLSTSTISATGNISFGGPVSGGITCDTRTREDFAGTQIGADFARLNLNGWNLHLGSTVRYLGANTQDGTQPVSIPGPRPFATICRSPSLALTPPQATEVFSSTGRFARIFSKRGL
jgi:hypothetical protein